MARRKGQIVASREFSLTYKGPALSEGRIRVRDLAPALIALGDLFQVAREVAEPDAPPIHLEVRAFEDGSFRSALVAVMEGAGLALLSDPANALSNLITLVGDPQLGVFGILKRIGGRISSLTRNDDGSTTITTENGDVYNFPNATKPVFNILEAPRGRDAAHTVLEPLRKQGITEAELTTPELGSLELTEDAAAVLDQLEEKLEDETDAEPIIDTTFEAFVSPITFSFDSRTKWRLQMGDQRISAKFADDEYMAKFHRHEEGIYEDDTMVVKIRMRQWATEIKKSIDYSIVKVIKHNHPGKDSEQLELPEEDG